MTQDVHCGHRRQSHHPVPPLPLQGAFLAARASCGRNYRSITDRLLINYCSSWRTGDGVQSYFIVNTRSKRTHCAPQSAGDRVC